MAKKKRKQAVPSQKAETQECCELYNEYCYPCDETSDVERVQKQGRAKRP